MLRIDLTLLAGRFHATPWGRHVNEGEPEWPPSPWRLLRALVSSWKRTAPHLSEKELQPLFSKLAEAPSFHLPAAVAGHTRHYMPQANEKKLLVHDPYIKVARAESGEFEPLSIIWESVELSEAEEQVLDRLLLGICYFGRAESWCELKRNPAHRETNAFPSNGEGTKSTTSLQVLCPEPKATLAQLMVETYDLQKKGYNRPPGSRFLSYRRAQDALTPKRQQRKTTEKVRHLAVFLIQARVLPHRKDLLRIADWARMGFNGRYGRLFDDQVSACFTGKKNGEARNDDHQHAFFLPHSSDFAPRESVLDRLYLYSPEGFGNNELEVIKRIRSFPDLRRQSSGRTRERFKLTPIELLGKDECGHVFGTSQSWVSWSPFLCNRHPKKNGKDSPEEQVRLECERRGLPELLEVEFLAEPVLKKERGLPRWVDYVSRRWRKQSPKAPPCGFRLRFAEPVTGPLVLGGECHFGMGQFVPDNLS